MLGGREVLPRNDDEWTNAVGLDSDDSPVRPTGFEAATTWRRFWLLTPIHQDPIVLNTKHFRVEIVSTAAGVADAVAAADQRLQPWHSDCYGMSRKSLSGNRCRLAGSDLGS